ncbi:MAG TPA: ABC transporter permease [Polyangiales bacterium]|nr:ABC transporter permease [Polyangiales bacterium]
MTIQAQPLTQHHDLEDPVHEDDRPRTLVQTMTAPLSAFGQDMYGLWTLLRQTVQAILQGRVDRESTFAQLYSIGNGSVLFITVTMIVLGMILVVQAGMQTQRVLPELSLLGANIIQLLAREFAPTVCAMMLATRVGAGIAAEIGSMVVTDQVDALRMSGAQPVDYLVVPRLIAGVLMTLALSFWSLFIALMAGTFAANTQFDLNISTFVNFSFVNMGDYIVMTLKAIAYGAAIPIVSSQRGLTTFGGSEGVGWATTNAVVHSSIAIILLDLILSVFGYIAFPPV